MNEDISEGLQYSRWGSDWGSPEAGSSSGMIGLTYCTVVRCPHVHFFPEIPSVNRFADMNEDILHLIFEHFDLEPGSQSPPQTRKDLLSAAKVCKAFRDLL